jgi:cytochrome c peroxidase
MPRASSWLRGALLLATSAMAQTPAVQTAAALYQGADLALGQRLIAEHGCAACHSRKAGGDGSAIYRPQGRINTPGALRGMVEQCNLELNLALFPDEVTAISAVLNRDHYRFH